MFSLFYLSFSLAILLQSGLVSAMKIQLEPYEYDGIVPTSFKITCIPEFQGRNCASKILAIQVSKNNGRPLASMAKDSGITYNPLLRASVRAEGHIGDDVTKSRLTVTFKDVMKEDSGSYTCKMMYLDQWGFLQQVFDSKNFTMGHRDTHDVVRYLVSKLTSLEETILAQQRELTSLKNDRQGEGHGGQHNNNDTSTSGYHRQLSASLAELTRRMDAQEGSLRTFQRTKAEHKGLHTRLEKAIETQAGVLQVYETQLSAYQGKIQELEAKVNGLGSRLVTDGGERGESKVVIAFRAGYSNAKKLKKDSIIIFNQNELNLGAAYDSTTGYFTAPEPGVYVFHLMLMTDEKEAYVHAVIQKNIQTVVTLRSRDKTYYEQNSVSAVMFLSAGDKASVKVTFMHGASYLDSRTSYSVFSGYLLARSAQQV